MIPIIPPVIVKWGAVAAVLVITHVGTYQFAKKIGEQSAMIDVEKQNTASVTEHMGTLLAQQSRYNDGVSAIQKSIASLTPINKTVITTVEKEIESNPTAYDHVVLPDSSMQLLAANATTLNAKRVSSRGADPL